MSACVTGMETERSRDRRREREGEKWKRVSEKESKIAYKTLREAAVCFLMLKTV